MTGRREFPLSVRRDAYKRSGGICECHRLMPIPGIDLNGCGKELEMGKLRFEHIVCDGIGGGPTLDNCAVITEICWRTKTYVFDLPTVAKTKRQAQKHAGTFRPSRHPMRHRTLRKKVNGEVVLR